MSGFAAIVLICLSGTAVEDCTEKTAVDVLSRTVDNELHCAMGWQDIIARTPLSEDVGKTVYIRTLCRRIAGDP